MQDDLNGITVVSLEQAVAAPYATSKLADAGARVLKIERPGSGDFARQYDNYLKGHSIHFVWLNRGKESVCINLKDEGELAFLKTLILSADVFVQNLRPGTLGKLGLASKDLRATNNRLITCDISGFGEDGPNSHLKAYDLIVQAESGLCSITGSKDGPARVGVSVCDISAGMTAHAAIVQALFARERTGKGRGIKVSLFDSIADWMNVPVLQSLYGNQPVERAGVAHPSIAPYGAFTCKDGKQIIFSIQSDREWKTLCTDFFNDPSLITDEQFATNVSRVTNRKKLDAMTSQKFSELTSDQVAEKLEEIGIAYGRMRTLEDASHHPNLRFINIDTPDGESVRVIAPGAILTDDAPAHRAYPAIGEHTEGVKRELAERTGP
jgi:crotonobetainyl-CoA:carnitine CoA-transferase CaiB-like acyl-CoA transferase